MTSLLSRELRREVRRLSFYRCFDRISELLIVLSIVISSFIIANHFSEIFIFENFFKGFFGLLMVIPFILFCKKWIQRPFKTSLKEAALHLEKQSSYFATYPEKKGELISAALFTSSTPGSFEEAHRQYWENEIKFVSSSFFPSIQTLKNIFVSIFFIASAFYLKNPLPFSIPTSIIEWHASQFEIKPVGSSQWELKKGSISGASGSLVRLKISQSRWLKTFVFIEEENGIGGKILRCAQDDKGSPSVIPNVNSGDDLRSYEESPGELSATTTNTTCLWKLNERGRYAVGTALFRSSFFPMQVFPDEKPRSLVFIKEGKDLIPSATVEVFNKKNISLHLSSQDDFGLTKMELVKRSAEGEEAIIWSQALKSTHVSAPYELSLEGWKGGQTEVFIRAYDFSQHADSPSLVLKYEDEESLRKKRLQNLEAFLDEWIHVLGDLLEAQQDKVVSSALAKRLKEMVFPTMEEGSLLAAFVRELGFLKDRIENWQSAGESTEQLPDLIVRTERQILYGISLLFQEKAGSLQNSSSDLKASKDHLQDLIEQAKRGDIKLDSKMVEDAFKKLQNQLAELRKKMAEMPQGPQDNMINRQAIEESMDQSDELAARIEEIKKQIKEGKNADAVKELESLTNQLGILSKMVDQQLKDFQSHLDQGALQALERHQKKLKEVEKKQKDLKAETEKLKERFEKAEKKSQQEWKPQDPEQVKKFDKEFKAAQKKQEGIKKEMEDAIQEFDKALKGSELENVLRSTEFQGLEGDATSHMDESGRQLEQQNGFQSSAEQEDALQKLMSLQKKQDQIMQQLKSSTPMGQQQSMTREKVQIIDSEGKGQRERRRKILDSLQQKVDEPFQDSHQKYFEELLQR